MIPYTRLHCTNRQNLRDLLPLNKPFTLLVEPSSLCNFRCIQCFQSLDEVSYFTENRQNMPFDIYLKVVEQLKAWDSTKLKVLKLSLYGEPLLNPDFCEMLKEARKADIAERIETTTNASLLTEKIVECLIEYKLDYLRVSIYSPYQSRHEEITSTKLDIGLLHENLKKLQNAKRKAGSDRPYVALKMLDTYGPDNEAFFEKYRDTADEIYIDKPHDWISSTERRFTDAIYGDRSEMVHYDLENNKNRKMACPMAFTTMAVRSSGDIAPCCIDYAGGTNIGNIRDRSIKEIWNSDEWFEFMKMQLEDRKAGNSSCRYCRFYLSSHYIKDDIDGFDPQKLRRK